MVSRKGVKESQMTFLITDCQFIVSLEVIIQLEEDLKVSLEGLWGHIVWLLQIPL